MSFPQIPTWLDGAITGVHSVINTIEAATGSLPVGAVSTFLAAIASMAGHPEVSAEVGPFLALIPEGVQILREDAKAAADSQAFVAKVLAIAAPHQSTEPQP